jgi:hypothetical protein
MAAGLLDQNNELRSLIAGPLIVGRPLIAGPDRSRFMP